MTKSIIMTEKGPAAIGLYSQGVKAGNLIFTSGQLPLNGSGELVTDVEGATRQALDNIKAILEAAGSSLANVVKTVVYLRDINDFAAMNAIYATYFPHDPPARSALQPGRLPRDAVLEIEAVALVE
ncbi:MAG TPA: Rid family detoxifying hydrolase [Desulfitobacteriaceae bacterium]|nr:Rid family detoxifying hydrolase [Desulfitobacteriaceae bacterium]